MGLKGINGSAWTVLQEWHMGIVVGFWYTEIDSLLWVRLMAMKKSGSKTGRKYVAMRFRVFLLKRASYRGMGKCCTTNVFSICLRTYSARKWILVISSACKFASIDRFVVHTFAVIILYFQQSPSNSTARVAKYMRLHAAEQFIGQVSA